MQPRVTAILVARNGAANLETTLSALNAQTRRPDVLVAVDAGSKDSTAALLATAAPTQFVTAGPKSSFGSALAHAVQVALPPTTEDDWLWLLGADNAPAPDALAQLLGSVEVAPSVAVAGPKLMRSDEPDIIARYGESMTRLGASVVLVENELDQAQYDNQSDLLAVSAAGMLVRRWVWELLGGFDPGLPSVDAALDFCVRVRLAGHRVIGVPSARILSAGGPELFGRTTVSTGLGARLRRRAQLHRRMVYARGLAPLFVWLWLVPLAILRCLLQLLRKQPGLIGAELGAAFATAFGGGIAAARGRIRRTRKLSWTTIAGLRVSRSAARERSISRPRDSDDGGALLRVRASFISGGGLGVVVLAAIIGVIVFGRLLGATAIQGGALLPLSPNVPQLWANVGYGWHSVAGGFVGASDPFAAVLAVLGSLTFWAPSFSIVLLYLAALPLSALGAWWCATRIATRAWPPAIAALLWAVAPPFLASMEHGNLGAVIAHILLPWLALTVIAAARSWSASAVAALLFAAVAASAPSLVPALVVLLIVWMAVNPSRIHRLIGIPIPAAALFAPLIYAQVRRGTPLALLADPGPATGSSPASPLQLITGSPQSDANGWASLHSAFGAVLTGPLLYELLLIPLVLLALASAFIPGFSRGIPSLVIALLGFATAVGATLLSLTTSGSSTVTLWPGPGLSLMWLGLIGGAVVTLEAFGRFAALPSLVGVLASGLAVAPLLIAPLAGTALAEPGSGGVLPAYVVAVGTPRPNIGTLVLTPDRDGSLATSMQRGAGDTLDEQSTLASTARSVNSTRNSILTLAGNLASKSGLDTSSTLDQQHIGFVLLGDAHGSEAALLRSRAEVALNDDSELTPVGTTPMGLLWRYNQLPRAGLDSAHPTGEPVRGWILGGLGVVFLICLLLAVPIRGARRRTSVATVSEERATLGEDDDA